MKEIEKKIQKADWPAAAESLHTRGYALIPGILTAKECTQLIGLYDHDERYRKTVVMERYRFGLGEYKYFSYPLPPLLQTLREAIYPHLAPVANQWMEWVGMDTRFPDTLEGLLKQCHEAGQKKPTALILKYGEGGYNALHQDLYGDVFFPMQMVFFLNQAGEDFTGGEFVMTEQTPRAQSKAAVLNPDRGDMLVFTTNFRPVPSKRGHYRAKMRHGVSEVRSGERHTLGIIFHDALS